MLPDLTFRDKQLESQFREDLVQRSRPVELQLRVLGCLTWLFQALRANNPTAAVPSVLGLLASASSLWVACWQAPTPLRLRYMLLATGNCVQMMCGCLAYHSVYRSSGQDSALLAVFTVASGNGALYLLAFTKLTPLPFRWQLALLAALTGVLLRHTAFFCTNALLLGGYQLLHRAACRMLPGAARWMSAEGSAQAAPQAAAAALCWRYQASSALLSAAAVGLHLYLSERQRRRDFAEKRRRRAGGQVAGPSAARALQGSRRGGAVPAAAAAGNEPVWCRQLAGEEEFALLLAVAPLLLVALCFFL